MIPIPLASFYMDLVRGHTSKCGTRSWKRWFKKYKCLQCIIREDAATRDWILEGVEENYFSSKG